MNWTLPSDHLTTHYLIENRMISKMETIQIAFKKLNQKCLFLVNNKKADNSRQELHIYNMHPFFGQI